MRTPTDEVEGAVAQPECPVHEGADGAEQGIADGGQQRFQEITRWPLGAEPVEGVERIGKVRRRDRRRWHLQDDVCHLAVEVRRNAQSIGRACRRRRVE
jgi:hypothetical protein